MERFFMQKNIFLATLASVLFSGNVFAEDISGIWQQIDDKTGAAKSIIKIDKEANNTYTGKIVKVTPVLAILLVQHVINVPLHIPTIQF
jgi:hypothetical protein